MPARSSRRRTQRLSSLRPRIRTRAASWQRVRGLECHGRANRFRGPSRRPWRDRRAARSTLVATAFSPAAARRAPKQSRRVQTVLCAAFIQSPRREPARGERAVQGVRRGHRRVPPPATPCGRSRFVLAHRGRDARHRRREREWQIHAPPLRAAARAAVERAGALRSAESHGAPRPRASPDASLAPARVPGPRVLAQPAARGGHHGRRADPSARITRGRHRDSRSRRGVVPFGGPRSRAHRTLSASALGRPAATRRRRAGARLRAAADRPRRADLRARRLGAGGAARTLARSPVASRPRLPLHLARSRRGERDGTARGRDVSRPGRRAGAHGAPPRGAAPSVYARAGLRRPARCPMGGAGALTPYRRAHIHARARARLPLRAAMPVGDYALPYGAANTAGGRYGPPRGLLAERRGRSPDLRSLNAPSVSDRRLRWRALRGTRGPPAPRRRRSLRIRRCRMST